MNRVHIPEKARQVQAVLQADPRVQLAWVFGSVASSKDQAASDLDLAVLCDHPLSPDEQVELAQNIERQTQIPIDLLDLRQAHGPILIEALSKGMMIIRRNPELHARLLSRMWLEEADYGPLRRRIQSARRSQVFGTAKNPHKKDGTS